MQITKEEIKRVVSNVQNYTLAKKYLKHRCTRGTNEIK